MEIKQLFLLIFILVVVAYIIRTGMMEQMIRSVIALGILIGLLVFLSNTKIAAPYIKPTLEVVTESLKVQAQNLERNGYIPEGIATTATKSIIRMRLQLFGNWALDQVVYVINLTGELFLQGKIIGIIKGTIMLAAEIFVVASLLGGFWWASRKVKAIFYRIFNIRSNMPPLLPTR